MYQTKIISRQLIVEKTWSIILSKPAGFNFQPGQFAFLGIPGVVKNIAKPFSIASSPSQEYLRIIYRSSDSDYKKALDTWPPDKELDLRGPFGQMIIKPSIFKQTVFLIGGIGIAPILSYLEKPNLDARFSLFWSNQTLATSPDLNLVKNLVIKAGCQFIPTFTKEKVVDYEQGRINLVMLEKYLKSWDNQYYIIGGTEFVNNLKELLLGRSINKESIISESFG